MSIIGSNALAGASGQAGAGPAPSGFQIDRSLRFNSADSAHLYRQITTKGNTKTFTFSCWLKKTRTGHIAHNIFSGSTGTDTGAYFCIPDNGSNALGTADSLVFKSDNGGGGGSVQTDAIFRDLSAWYHVVLAVDTTQATASDRVKIWVNGVSQTLSQSASPGYPNQNSELSINDVGHAAIGAEANGSSSSVRFLGSFYLAEIHFLDGTAVSDVSDFGELDSNNVWQPKEVSGVTYGTNGFHLNFSDNSSNAALGYDAAGSNDWTVNNITAAAFGWASTTWSNDISIDSGNYYLNNNDGPNGFDGNSATYIDCRLGTGANNTTNIIWEPTGGISGVTKIRVNSNYADDYRINNGTWTSFSSGGSYTQIYSGSSFTLTKLEIRRTSNSGSDYGHRVTAYEINDIEVRDNLAQSGNASGVDSLIDTPTNYTASSGNNGGNYCTLNPLDNGGASVTNGNLDWDSGGNQSTRSTFFVSSGKWYWELTYNESNLIGEHGVSTRETQVLTGGTAWPGSVATSWGFSNSSGNKSNNNSFTSIATAGAQGDVVMIALDMDNGKIWWGRNGTWFGSGDPSAGTNAAFTNLSGYSVSPMAGVGGAAAGAVSYNFGQRPFAYTPPNGYVSLCTTNLADPTIADGSTAIDAKLITADGTQSIDITGYNFSPDFVWLKARSAAYNHQLHDAVRGVNNFLVSNATSAQDTQTGTLTAFNSDGFTLGTNSNSNYSGTAGTTSVGWAWDAGSSTVSNTDGSITSSVRANASAGFSIVSYTGNGSAASVGHGLNATPGFYFIKNRSSAVRWTVYHTSIGPDGNVFLNETGGVATNSGVNGTSGPDSSVFYLKTSYGEYNTNGDNYIAYCFAPVEGYSAFGSYTGNGSTDGPFIYTGFKPSFVLTKSSSAVEQWVIWDAARDTYNAADDVLWPNSSSNEDSNSVHDVDFLSNGFKLRYNHAMSNANGTTYIYAAFAEHPLSLNGGLAR